MLRRRDLNPGDVFVYVSLPEPLSPTIDPCAVRVVMGQVPRECWYAGALGSPTPGYQGVEQAVLDSPVVLIPPPKPEDVMAALQRAEVKEAEDLQEFIDCAIAASRQGAFDDDDYH